MVGMTTYTATELLKAITDQGTFTEVTAPYLALFTVAGTDAGTGFTEAAYTGYARQLAAAASWNAPTGTSPTTVSTSAAVNFPVCTNSASGVIETEIAWGIYDASTAGNLISWDFLGNYTWQPFNCTLASPGVFTVDGGGYTFANGDQVVVTAEYGGTLPTGVSATTLYTVAGVSGNTFNIGVNTSTIGNGMIRKVVPQQVVTNLQPIVSAGNAVISAA